MKKEIKIVADGNVTVNVKITGVVGAGYYLDLFEKKSNNVIFSYSGTNVYSHDDNRVLPNSAKMNLGRVLMLNTTVVSIDDDTDEEKNFKISLQIFQNNKLVDEAIISDKLKKEHKNFLTIVKLVSS
ncbi:M26 IgA1-specific Metallo-endopeptidase C-terminal domain protein [Chryseobacterium sp. StRB126]|uniref:hypothetical protein n=1 Tax=Chryseobacterium sp. StRB126 TaxID=878220 RepID=UPI0004E98B86|nr:hypothetical protein [Chryseobacterium sp. StRB126]BAP29090.1 M26 IgA1-specific Metallo-endopeptidase C-terminal domain protein [Chryseobacterium sp. StRB126]